MKVLVTGGFGYLGAVLVERFIEYGLRVKVIDINYFGIPDSKIFESDFLEYHIKDMRKFSEADVKDCNAVVHLASISNDPVDSLPDLQIYGPSVAFTEKLARICKKLDVHLVFPSSCSVYGIQQEFVNEGSNLLPQTGYSRNKVEIEKLLISESSTDFQPTILRLATVYGYSPSMRFDTVINMLVGMAVVQNNIQLNSDGESWRPFVHIEDVIRVIFSAVVLGQIKDPAKNSILNVGRNEDNARVIDISRMIQKFAPEASLSISDSERSAVREGDVFSDRKVSNGKDKRSYKVNFDALVSSELYSPQIELLAGVERLVKETRDMNLSQQDFKDDKYYRLQHLESLRKQGSLNEVLEKTT